MLRASSGAYCVKYCMREIISEIVAVMLLWLLGIVTWLLLLGLFMVMLKHIT